MPCPADEGQESEDGHAGAILKAFRVGAELARASWEHEAGEGANYSVDRALDGHRDLRSARFAELGASQARRFAALLASHAEAARLATEELACHGPGSEARRRAGIARRWARRCAGWGLLGPGMAMGAYAAEQARSQGYEGEEGARRWTLDMLAGAGPSRHAFRAELDCLEAPGWGGEIRDGLRRGASGWPPLWRSALIGYAGDHFKQEEWSELISLEEELRGSAAPSTAAGRALRHALAWTDPSHPDFLRLELKGHEPKLSVWTLSGEASGDRARAHLANFLSEAAWAAAATRAGGIGFPAPIFVQPPWSHERQLTTLFWIARAEEFGAGWAKAGIPAAGQAWLDHFAGQARGLVKNFSSMEAGDIAAQALREHERGALLFALAKAPELRRKPPTRL